MQAGLEQTISLALPVDPAALERVLQPIEGAPGLPNAAYARAEFARFERDQVLARNCFCIGFGKDIPLVGDAKPVNLMGLPLIMVRRHDHSIGVFHNVCSHRGAVLLETACNVQKSFRCPYHAWVYDLTGKLLATPNIGGPKQHSCDRVDKRAHFPDLPDKWGRAAEYAALFPNVLLGIHQDHYFAILLEPVAVDRTIERLEIYYVGEAAQVPGYAATRAANLATWKTVFDEDVGIVERLQRGRQSPGFAGGVFSPRMDPPTHCFHKWLARAALAVL